MAEGYQQGSYGNRPLWQWVLIYGVIAIVVYGLIYYFVLAKRGGYSYPAGNGQLPTGQMNTSGAPTGNIYTTKTDPTKGAYLTDFQGMTLYTFDKDTQGVSNCNGNCAALWPAYSSGATAESMLPTNITVITRSDGSKQFAFKGKPLYYFANDKMVGDLKGDGYGGVWHIVKP